MECFALRSLRSAPVGAKRSSTGRTAPHNPALHSQFEGPLPRCLLTQGRVNNPLFHWQEGLPWNQAFDPGIILFQLDHQGCNQRYPGCLGTEDPASECDLFCTGSHCCLHFLRIQSPLRTDNDSDRLAGLNL